ncbi:DNA-directed RNA polymerase sigma-70 factor [Fulvitalea axinellae]|uniref:DNA-directed RNA polymerase sigma-70 factor n=1 Tax=Fulvitalea axinellae TaxID=1182444 RepID=A0AAU9CMJ6_9BACT|nr:DNA-directed RNA polymerase sigma-70 factor [Fulvitalea axinellae]
MEKLTELEFERMYGTYYGRLCAYSYRLVKNSEEAQELVDEVFMDMWEKGTKPAEEDKLRGYLFRSVLYKSANCLNRREVRRKYEAETIRTGTFSEDQVNQLYAYKELYGELDKAIDNLPERCREVFEMSRFSGLGNKEIAKELGVSVKAVEGHITKALSKIRTHLMSKGVELVGLLMAVEVIRKTSGELFFNFF